MNDKPKHTYPDRYPPGAHWATDEAWRILDIIEPGAIPEYVRAYIAGRIAGALMKVASEGEPDAAARLLMKVASGESDA